MSEQQVKPSSALAGKIAGFDICRRAIYQTAVGRDQWANDMLKAMLACKMLGVQTFEIDVRHDPTATPPEGKKEKPAAHGLFFSISSAYGLEDEGWKTEKPDTTDKRPRGADVLTLYAVVVE